MNKRILTISTCLVLAISVQAQKNKTAKKGGKGGGETGIALGAGVNYFIPTGNQKNNTQNFLLLNKAISVGAEISFIPNKSTTRFKLAAEYITGSNNKEGIAAYAKEKDIVYTSYKFTKANPSGFSIMASPQFMLFPKSQNKKLPLIWLDLKAGALFSNQQALQFFNGQSTSIKEVKSNAVSFVYSPSLVVNVVKTKQIFLNVKAGYSNWGGFGIGVGVAESDCHNVYCYRCPGGGCLPY
jgi:hypothetical protein